ncbi:Calcineurin-like phosphoesterase [Seminavis robusta]|uniref:Calcineurin-like phosphoesterase n=1 Tax=Seminavis robusta TaxID=568900 RepID=A0A9N8DDW0_9STRA|nr:Calcineurin-like phosphoesterase [Seminavis robusta]|eukprot:Sro93_g048710.1 Calcineurin-like phosphoesterase (624) ;mRNA; r:110377-112248
MTNDVKSLSGGSMLPMAWLLSAMMMGSCVAFIPRHHPRVEPSTLLHIGATSNYLSFTGQNTGASVAAPQQISSGGGDDEFVVGVLGDLHIDPRKFDDYEIGREHWLRIFDETRARNCNNLALVSLGDLGESKSVRPKETSELFAGTTECHMMAAEYLRSLGVEYEVVGGNHDLEGIDEFKTDEENLELFLRAHNKPAPQFLRYIGEKTALVGLTSTVFRDAKYTSHEVTIDEDQLNWFEEVVTTHPASEGWKIFVFTHAPPNGSGLRVLQENHVVNGCCWLNHSNENQCRKFIELVRENRCIKAWFSGHFHLGQDYQDSITFPTVDPSEGPYPNRGSCVFAQTSVMRAGTSRDGRQQSRLIRGNNQGFEICTIDHANNGALRVDATINYKDCNHEVGVYAHEDITRQGDQFFKVYAPCAGDSLHPPDENLIGYDEYGEIRIDTPITVDSKAWWYMADGRVMGLLNGMMIEYDRSTLAPLGLVCGADELVGKRIAVVDSGIEQNCFVGEDLGMEGADCTDTSQSREQALLLVSADNSVVVVQPNEDGSFWRKIVRNKMIREREKRRELAAKEFLDRSQPVQWSTPGGASKSEDVDVVSSWGPYTSTQGTAKKTGVSGLTAPAMR